MNRPSESTGSRELSRSGELNQADLESGPGSDSLSSQATLLPQRQPKKGDNCNSYCWFLLGLSIANALMVGASVAAGKGLAKWTHSSQQDQEYDSRFILCSAAGSILASLVVCAPSWQFCYDYVVKAPTPERGLLLHPLPLSALLGAADIFISILMGCLFDGKDRVPFCNTFLFAGAVGATITSVVGMSTLFCLPKDNKDESYLGQGLDHVADDHVADQHGGRVSPASSWSSTNS